VDAPEWNAAPSAWQYGILIETPLIKAFIHGRLPRLPGLYLATNLDRSLFVDVWTPYRKYETRRSNEFCKAGSQIH